MNVCQSSRVYRPSNAASVRFVAARQQHQTFPVRWSPLTREVTCIVGATPTFEAETSSASGVTEGNVDYFLTDKRPVILFDGVCNLCNGAVNLMLDIDPQGAFRLAALQSRAGKALLQRCGRAPDDISSIVLVEESGFHIQSEAVLRIAQGLQAGKGPNPQVPFPLLAAVLLPVPRFVRDPLYDLVADNRYSVFGRTDRCRLSDARYTERFIAE